MIVQLLELSPFFVQTALVSDSGAQLSAVSDSGSHSSRCVMRSTAIVYSAISTKKSKPHDRLSCASAYSCKAETRIAVFNIMSDTLSSSETCKNKLVVADWLSETDRVSLICALYEINEVIESAAELDSLKAEETDTMLTKLSAADNESETDAVAVKVFVETSRADRESLKLTGIVKMPTCASWDVMLSETEVKNIADKFMASVADKDSEFELE